AASAAFALSLITEHAALLHELGFIVAACLFPVLGLRLAFWNPGSRASTEGASKRSALWLGASIAALNPAPLVTWATFLSLLHAWRITVNGALIPFFGLAGGAGVLSWNLLLVGLLKRHLGKVPVRLMAMLVRGIGFLLLAIGLWAALNALHLVKQPR
ncbi:MAG TPA: hypothetical protein VHV51_15240, partial [Polyangiaceae bacterium]|nr:hypothetical protein [Polyangiaceae bacterium]